MDELHINRPVDEFSPIRTKVRHEDIVVDQFDKDNNVLIDGEQLPEWPQRIYFP